VRVLLAQRNQEEKGRISLLFQGLSNISRDKHHALLSEWARLSAVSRVGMPCSEEKRRKISDSLMGRNLTETHKKNIGLSGIGKKAWNKGIPQSEEAKRKIGLASIGRPNVNKGKTLPASWCKKLSLAQKRRWTGYTKQEKARYVSLQRRPRYPNSIESAVQAVLVALGISFEAIYN